MATNYSMVAVPMDNGFVLAADPPTRPKAAADQFDVQAWEGGLLDLARVHHPTVAWWHGYRRTEGGDFGSLCYICEEFVATWGGNGSPSQVARAEINRHKIQHRMGMVPAVSTDNTRGTQQ